MGADLTAADYRFVWFDGLNRFYVASEHHDALAHAFKLPPNVFDDFMLAVAAPSEQRSPVKSVHVDAFPDGPIKDKWGRTLDPDQRIEMATRCRDADVVPKVPDAGLIVTEPDGSRVQIMHNGLKVRADGYYGPWMTSLIAQCRGHHEPQEERIFHEVLKFLPGGGTMLELGGHWAYYSLWFLTAGVDRKAIIVEPDPAHLAVGVANAGLNGVTTEFIAGFVGSEPAPLAPFMTEESGEVMLPCVSVPRLLAERNIDRLEILHCDAQGAELAVLKSCAELLESRRIAWVFVSTHAYQITGDPLTHQRCIDFLVRMGGVIEAEHDVHESFSGDGLIVARFAPPPDNWTQVNLSRNRYSESLFPNPAYDLAVRLAQESGAHSSEECVTSAYNLILMRPPVAFELQYQKEVLQKEGGPSHVTRHL